MACKTCVDQDPSFVIFLGSLEVMPCLQPYRGLTGRGGARSHDKYRKAPLAQGSLQISSWNNNGGGSKSCCYFKALEYGRQGWAGW